MKNLFIFFTISLSITMYSQGVIYTKGETKGDTFLITGFFTEDNILETFNLGYELINNGEAEKAIDTIESVEIEFGIKDDFRLIGMKGIAFQSLRKLDIAENYFKSASQLVKLKVNKIPDWLHGYSLLNRIIQNNKIEDCKKFKIFIKDPKIENLFLGDFLEYCTVPDTYIETLIAGDSFKKTKFNFLENRFYFISLDKPKNDIKSLKLRGVQNNVPMNTFFNINGKNFSNELAIETHSITDNDDITLQIRSYRFEATINADPPLNTLYNYDKIWKAAKFWESVDENRYDTLSYNWKLQKGKIAVNSKIQINKGDKIFITVEGDLIDKNFSGSHYMFLYEKLKFNIKTNKNVVNLTSAAHFNKEVFRNANRNGLLEVFLNIPKTTDISGSLDIDFKILRRYANQFNRRDYFEIKKERLNITYSKDTFSSIKVKKGLHYKVSELNQISHNHYGQIQLNGILQDSEHKKIDRYNYGALLCRLNPMQGWLPVSEIPYFTAGENGLLEFTINATDFNNYTGEHEIEIEVASRLKKGKYQRIKPYTMFYRKPDK